MKKILTTSILLGTVLAASPGIAQPATEWQEVKVFAIRFVHPGTGDPTLMILKDEPYHDTAVVWEGAEINWDLSCIGCVVAATDEPEMAIYDVTFVGDLDELTNEAVAAAPTNPTDPLPPGLGVRRGKQRTPPGLKNNFFGAGKAKGAAKGGPVKADVLPTMVNGSELWKYSIMVEVDLDAQPNSQNCIETNNAGMVVKLDKTCCDAKSLCEYWDPHIYMHGDMDF